MISCTIGDHRLNYDPETKQQSIEWRHSGSLRPPQKNSECKNPLENFSPRFFGIKTASSSLIIFQRAKLSMRSITDLCWCNLRPFWRKNAAESSPKGFFSLHDNAPVHRALATPKKLAYLGFHCLDHPPYSTDLAPSDYHLFPGLKKNWKVSIFRPTWKSLLPRRPGWTDNLLNFFWEACKSESNGLRSVLSFAGSMLNKSRVRSM